MGAGFAAGVAGVKSFDQAIQGLGGAILGFNGQLEQVEISFKSLFEDRSIENIAERVRKAGEDATNTINELRKTAVESPFRFQDLLKGSRLLAGVGFTATETATAMKDITTVAATFGGSEESIIGISRAMAQMAARGKISAQEMNQLANNNVAAWKILGESAQFSGKVTQAELRKMGEQGLLTAEMFFDAFHEYAEAHKDAPELLSKSFLGALSNIKDGVENFLATAFKPFFETIRDVTASLGSFLTDTGFQASAQVIAESVKGMIAPWKPLTDAIKEALYTFQKTGDIEKAIDTWMHHIQNFSKSLFGEGQNLMKMFADGIMSGANSVIQTAANYVADIIANFLVGHSPPPEGPLAGIIEGGINLMRAYAEGLKLGGGEVVGVANSLSGGILAALDVIKNPKADAGLRTDSIQKISAELDRIKNSSEAYESIVRGINGQLRENADAQNALKFAAEDIKQAYEDQINPLQRQIEDIKTQNDFQERLLDLKGRQMRIDLDAARIAAEGDPVRRAELAGRLEAIRLNEQDIRLRQDLRRVNAEISNEEAGYQQKILDIDEKITNLRDKANDTSDKNAKEKINKQIQELTYDKQRLQQAERANNLEATSSADARADKLALLGLDKDRITITQDLNSLTDKTALAQIKSSETALDLSEKRRKLAEDSSKLEKDINVAGLQEQVKNLKREEQDRLAPIEMAQKGYKRQAEELQSIRDHYQALKQAEDDRYNDIKRAQAASEKAAKDRKDLEGKYPEGDKPTGGPLGDVAKRFSESLTKTWNSIMPSVVAGLMGAVFGAAALGPILGPLGAVAGALFGNSLLDGLRKRIPNFDSEFKDMFGTIASVLSGTFNKNEGFLKDMPDPLDPSKMVKTRVDYSPFQLRIAEITAQIQKFWNDYVVTAWNTLTLNFGPVFDKLKNGDLAGALGALGNAFRDIGTKLTGWIAEQVAKVDWKNIFTTIKNTASEAAGGFSTWIVEQLGKIDWQNVGQWISEQAVKMFIKVIEIVGGAVGGFFDGLISHFTGANPETGYAKFWKGVFDGLLNWDTWKAAFEGINVGAFIEGLLTLIFLPAKVLGIISRIPVIGEFLATVGNFIFGQGPLAALAEFVSRIGGKVSTTIGTALGNAFTSLTGSPFSFLNLGKFLLDAAKDFALWIFNNIPNAVQSGLMGLGFTVLLGANILKAIIGSDLLKNIGEGLSNIFSGKPVTTPVSVQPVVSQSPATGQITAPEIPGTTSTEGGLKYPDKNIGQTINVANTFNQNPGLPPAIPNPLDPVDTSRDVNVKNNINQDPDPNNLPPAQDSAVVGSPNPLAAGSQSSFIPLDLTEKDFDRMAEYADGWKTTTEEVQNTNNALAANRNNWKDTSTAAGVFTGEVANAAKALQQFIEQKTKLNLEEKNYLAQEDINAQQASAGERISEISQTKRGNFLGAAKEIAGTVAGGIGEFFNNFGTGARELVDSGLPNFLRDTALNLTNLFREMQGKNPLTLRDLFPDIGFIVKDTAPEMKQAASNMIDAFNEGYIERTEENRQKVIDTVEKAYADSPIAATNQTLKINSPSEVFIEIAQLTAEGFIKGINASQSEVSTTVTKWANDYIVYPVKQILGIDEEDSSTFFDIALSIINTTLKVFTDNATLTFTTIRDFAWNNIISAFLVAFGMEEGVDKPSTYMQTIAQTLLQTFADDALKKVDAVSAAAKTLGEKFVDAFTTELGNLSPRMQAILGNAFNGEGVPTGYDARAFVMAQKYGLDPKLFAAQLRVESGDYASDVVSGQRLSSKGAKGIAQFMPATAEVYAAKLGVSIEQFWGSIELQIEAAAMYMADLKAEFGSQENAASYYLGSSPGTSDATKYWQDILNKAKNMRSQAGPAYDFRTTSQLDLGASGALSPSEASKFCGPFAALQFANAVGRYPTAQEARRLALAYDWNPGMGMTDASKFEPMVNALLSSQGSSARIRSIGSDLSTITAPENANSRLAFSTQDHYFFSDMYDPATKKFRVGKTGTVVGGSEWMTIDEMRAVAGEFYGAYKLFGQAGPGDGKPDLSSLQRPNQAGGPAANAAKPETPIGTLFSDLTKIIPDVVSNTKTTDQLTESFVRFAANAKIISGDVFPNLSNGTITLNDAFKSTLEALAKINPIFGKFLSELDSGADASEVLAKTFSVVDVSNKLKLMQGTAVQPLVDQVVAGKISVDELKKKLIELADVSGFAKEPLQILAKSGFENTSDSMELLGKRISEIDPSFTSIREQFEDGRIGMTAYTLAILNYLSALGKVPAAAEAAADATKENKPTPPATNTSVTSPTVTPPTTTGVGNLTPDQVNAITTSVNSLNTALSTTNTTLGTISGTLNEISPTMVKINTSISDYIAKVSNFSIDYLTKQEEAWQKIKEYAESAYRAASKYKEATSTSSSTETTDGETTQSLALGGRVAGPYGEPRLVIAHGGEEFMGLKNSSPSGQVINNVNVYVNGSASGSEIGSNVIYNINTKLMRLGAR